jgi:extradiol dioxygenase family protein
MKELIYHTALAVDDINKARSFYLDALGCQERTDTSGENFSVINFFGSQLVLIEAPDQVEPSHDDPTIEPYKHFGLIMDWDDWHELVDTLKAKGVDFRIEPNIKDHEGIGKIGNMFVADPSGNFVEFKSYQDKSMVL